MVEEDYIVKSSQKISHFLHRHEPPVLGGNIVILQNEVDVVTVCKPASVPVHPCGQYRKNTVVGIMEAEHGLTPLFRNLCSKEDNSSLSYPLLLVMYSPAFRRDRKTGTVHAASCSRGTVSKT
ncbi:unnamed protein product [Triticum turgidum subsp. durum]|uniref:Pseudouridine synthase RsuA/RluA-like domain-containing protein n=1 Tax=Triticum turgidum subsp. durum TaxID=4567 RepID=A0A9R0WTG6_TRITD|nr:unnamed protein product [Triticum turgidum subsp. durum]